MLDIDAQNEKRINTLRTKGFKNYHFTCGQDKKMHDDGNLVAYNCKNYTYHDGMRFSSQTNRGRIMATKLIIREMRGAIKVKRGEIKIIKEGIEILKKTLA